MSILQRDEDELLLSITNGGYGKRTLSSEYRTIGRGGQGVTNMDLTDKNGGEVVASFPVTDDHQIMLVSDQGQLIRTLTKNIRITGRSAQGVKVFDVANDEHVVAVSWLVQEGDDEEADGEDKAVDDEGSEA